VVGRIAEFVARPEKVADPSYAPSFDELPAGLPKLQRATLAAVREIDGWLLDEDVLKLYELAFLATGPVLEIGTYRGRSAVVIGRALRDAGGDRRLYSLDVDPRELQIAARTIASYELADRVLLVRSTAARFLRRASGLAPSLVFVDGDHTRSGVARDLRTLRAHVPAGGMVLLHDYNDPRNADPLETDYGVVTAAEASWLSTECEFAGVFGASALFHRRSGAPGAEPASGVPVVDLGGRDEIRWWVKRRIASPASRRLKAYRRRFGG
jgi:MMP 1-O-methyltransferase